MTTKSRLLAPVLAALLALGCGADALRTQSHAALVTTAVVETAGGAADAARGAALDRVEAEHAGSADLGTALDEEAARWTPLGASLDAVRDALRAWVAAIELARTADMGEELYFELFVPLVARVVLLYDDFATLAQSLGADVPSLPAFVRAAASAPEGR